MTKYSLRKIKKSESVLKKVCTSFFIAFGICLFYGCGSTNVQDVAPVPEKEESVIQEEPPVVADEPPVAEEEPPAEVVEEKPVVEVVEVIEEPKITKTVPEFSFMTYRVRKGDDYHKIARKFYKVRHLWPCIYEANIEKYPNPDLIRVNARIKVPRILSISKEAENIKAGMFQAYNGYLNRISPKKSSRANSRNRNRAIGVLVSAELLIPGFINSNSDKFDGKHVAEAKRILKKKYRYTVR